MANSPAQSHTDTHARRHRGATILAMAALVGLASTMPDPANAAVQVYASPVDDGTVSDLGEIRGSARLHLYFSNGTSAATVPANLCTPSSDGDEVCQWAIQIEASGDLVIVDVGWVGMPVEDNEPSTPASLRAGTGGDAVFGQLGATKLATVSVVGTHGALSVKAPIGFGFVLPDGSVDDLSGATVTVAEARTVPWAGISTQGGAACGNLGNGEARCWGTAYGGSPDVALAYSQVTAGPTGACGIDFDETGDCWGTIGTVFGGDVLQVAAGGDGHICALADDLTIRCSGGAFGGGNSSLPGQYSMVSRGHDFACGIRLDGSVHCFGVPLASSPVNAGFVDISGGVDHACGLLGDGNVECWGANPGPDFKATPTLPTDYTGVVFTEISAGGGHSCAVFEGTWTGVGGPAYHTDRVHCWGDPSYSIISGAEYSTSTKYEQISLNTDGGCALTKSNSVECWGSVGAAPDVRLPLAAAGYDHSCKVDTDGELACWGDDTHDQVDPPPSLPSGPFTWLDANLYYSCAVADGGSASCWGLDGVDAVTTPTAGLYTKVATGKSHACGLLPDASIACWGDATSGKTTPGTPVDRSYLAIAAGADHTCGVLDDLSLHCWGVTADNRQDIPTTGEYTDLSLGETYGCARQTDGRVVCWGDGLTAITTPGGGFRNLAAAGGAICGLRANGKPDCWGLGLPNPETPRIQLASLGAGGFPSTTDRDHSCGPTDSGAFACWGDDFVVGDATAQKSIRLAPRDSDDDGLTDPIDNCPTVVNGPAWGTCLGGSAAGATCIDDVPCTGGGSCSLRQEDRDYDGVGDACDICPDDADDRNLDRDGDGFGDACDVCPDVTDGTQDPSKCAPAILFTEGGTDALLMSMSAGTMATGDFYQLKLSCPSQVDVAEINVGMRLPDASVTGTQTGPWPCSGCSPSAITWEPDGPNLVDATHRYIFWPGEIPGANPSTAFLSIRAHDAANGFCPAAGPPVTLAEIAVDSIPETALVTFSTFEFDEVVQYLVDNPGDTRDFVDVAFKDTDNEPVDGRSWSYGTAPDDDLRDVKIAVLRAAENDRDWVVELHSKVDLKRAMFAFEFEDASEFLYDTDVIHFLGCSTYDSGNFWYTCTAPGAATANGLGGTVDTGDPNTRVWIDPVDPRLWIDFTGNIDLDASSDVALVDTVDDDVTVARVMLGTLRMPNATDTPTVIFDGAAFDRPDAGGAVPLSEVQLGESDVKSSDVDSDLVTGDTDNCTYAFNPEQKDNGGLLTATANGTGDTCECGDGSGDGAVFTAEDATELQRVIVGLETDPAIRKKCSVDGDTASGEDGPSTCDIKDAVMVRLSSSNPSRVKARCEASQLDQNSDS